MMIGTWEIWRILAQVANPSMPGSPILPFANHHQVVLSPAGFICDFGRHLASTQAFFCVNGLTGRHGCGSGEDGVGLYLVIFVPHDGQ
jgi:hypothetical protein